MTSKMFETLFTLDQRAKQGEDIMPEFKRLCAQKGMDYLGQYIAIDTFPHLFEALN